MSKRAFYIALAIYFIVMGFILYGVIYVATDCYNWQNRPLDQVSRRCLK